MLIMITGGSKNGKSHIAEEIITKYNISRKYIATMEPFCEEAHIAIERHRKIRSGKGFETIEKYTDIDEIRFFERSAVLLECLCNLCANEIFSMGEKNPTEKIMRGIEKLSKMSEVFVLVTNQVGDDGIEYSSETMNYIKCMGELNRRLAVRADVVIEAVYGIPIILKGKEIL